LGQETTNPIRFSILCNDPKWVGTTYERYWMNALRRELPLEGVPFTLRFRRKTKKRGGGVRRSRDTQ
jgi:predicted GTPase